MKSIELSQMTVDQLLAHFADLGTAQDSALLGNNFKHFNRLFENMQAVVSELKGRSGDQRSALLTLYGHSNMQVRLKAAKNSLAVAPIAARQLLEEIQASQWQPQAGEAGMSLHNLDAGIFKPV